MIVDRRKGEGGSGDTPDGKKPKSEEDTMSRSEKIDKMYEVMMDMQRDMNQTKMLKIQTNSHAPNRKIKVTR